MHNRVFVCLFLYAKKIAEVQAFQSHSKKENTPFTRTFFQCSVNVYFTSRTHHKLSELRRKIVVVGLEHQRKRERESRVGGDFLFVLCWYGCLLFGAQLLAALVALLTYDHIPCCVIDLFVEIGVSFSETFDLRIVLTIYSFNKTFLFRYKLATFRRGARFLVYCLGVFPATLR